MNNPDIPANLYRTDITSRWIRWGGETKSYSLFSPDCRYERICIINDVDCWELIDQQKWLASKKIVTAHLLFPEVPKNSKTKSTP